MIMKDEVAIFSHYSWFSGNFGGLFERLCCNPIGDTPMFLHGKAWVSWRMKGQLSTLLAICEAASSL